MKKILASSAVALMLLTLSVTTAVHAQLTNTPPDESTTIILSNPLSTSSVGGIIDNVVNWLIKLSSPIAALMVIVGGIQILTSGGNEESFKKGRKTILYTAIGYGIIVVGSGIIKIIEAILNG